MNAFLYGTILQWKLDIRSRSLLITCYVVPLIFFALMGGIFTSVMPDMHRTLIQSMIVMGVSMGAFIGFPQILSETYGSDIQKIYRVNGVPIFTGVLSMSLSALVHLMTMCAIITLAAPLAFDAVLPENIPAFILSVLIYTAVSLSIGSCLGLLFKNSAKLTMAAQLIFLPSIMLSGIMFPASLLPGPLFFLGKLFPAHWGYNLMQSGGMTFSNLWYLIGVFILSVIFSAFLLKRRRDSV